MRVKVTSLDVRYKNDFPDLWNAVTSGVKASRGEEGTAGLATVCMKNPRRQVRGSVGVWSATPANRAEALGQASRHSALARWVGPVLLPSHRRARRAGGEPPPMAGPRGLHPQFFSLLCSLLGRKCPVLVFTPVFKCSNSSRQMCLFVPFTGHRLQNAATFSPQDHRSSCLFPNVLPSPNCPHCPSLRIHRDGCLGALWLGRNHLQAKINHCHLISLLIYY